MQHVFIVGSKGIPGAYGGYETFVDKLTEYHQNNSELKYHVACKNMDVPERTYHNARCFNVKVPDIGAAQAIYYDIAALNDCCKYIRQHNIKKPIVYILACRISIFCRYFQKKIHSMGGRLYVNPDGHEWKRSKWSMPVRKYWKYSERLMVKNSDLLVCDSKNIQKYIRSDYGKYNPNTTYIAYGAESTAIEPDRIKNKYNDWLQDNNLERGRYYLIVGRFVPENNYETMLREFMQSNTTRKLVVITTDNTVFYNELIDRLHFDEDERIRFTGTVYDKELLQAIREGAYAYLHGHEVGGTNPSLLEAMGATKLNLLLDVGFNKEVGEAAAMYWSKTDGELAALIDRADALPGEQYERYGVMAKDRIRASYSWEFISSQYESLFLGLEA